jgi:2-polyprenyl-6-methoxyphenol hydroxylase-like FAD-dependent oxidoreductase
MACENSSSLLALWSSIQVARIIFLGGGVCGLAGGMMLARDGHEVTVLERDAAPVPDSLDAAWGTWDRGGVTQFRLAHFLAPAGRGVLEQDLPEVLHGLVAAGAVRLDLLALMPPNLVEARPREGDERFVTYSARRPIFEQVLSSVAAEEPGLEVRRGTAVEELTTRPVNGTPHVDGVRLDSGETLLKRMRDPDLWTAVVEACSLHAHWLEGEPISELEAMGGVLDRYRRPLADGRPLVTGIALLGDAWACTNPSLGRGISLGLLHARALREVVGSHLDDPLELAEAWDAATEERMTPWYRETVEEDRDRLREIDALREGLEPAPPSERASVLRHALNTAAVFDPDLFRAYLDSRAVLKPLGQTFSEDGVAERALAVAGENQRLQLPGPSREQLMALLA